MSGALLAQYQGFADVQMGIGMVVWGLASVIIGEALVGSQASSAWSIVGAVMGSVLFRLLVAIASARRAQSQRPEADHRALRLRGAGAAPTCSAQLRERVPEDARHA